MKSTDSLFKALKTSCNALIPRIWQFPVYKFLNLLKTRTMQWAVMVTVKLDLPILSLESTFWVAFWQRQLEYCILKVKMIQNVSTSTFVQVILHQSRSLVSHRWVNQKDLLIQVLGWKKIFKSFVKSTDMVCLDVICNYALQCIRTKGVSASPHLAPTSCTVHCSAIALLCTVQCCCTT